MESYYIVIEPSGEYGLNKASALLEISKVEGEPKLNVKVVSDQDNITKCINKNFLSYLSKNDVLSYIRKDGGWMYYRVHEPKLMDEFMFKNDPFNWEDDISYCF